MTERFSRKIWKSWQRAAWQPETGSLLVLAAEAWYKKDCWPLDLAQKDSILDTLEFAAQCLEPFHKTRSCIYTTSNLRVRCSVWLQASEQLKERLPGRTGLSRRILPDSLYLQHDRICFYLRYFSSWHRLVQTLCYESSLYPPEKLFQMIRITVHKRLVYQWYKNSVDPAVNFFTNYGNYHFPKELSSSEQNSLYPFEACTVWIENSLRLALENNLRLACLNWEQS